MCVGKLMCISEKCGNLNCKKVCCCKANDVL